MTDNNRLFIISWLIVFGVLIILSSAIHIAIGIYKLKKDIRKKGIEAKLFSRMKKPWIALETRCMVGLLSVPLVFFLWFCILGPKAAEGIMPFERAAVISALPYILIELFYVSGFRCPCCNKRFTPWWRSLFGLRRGLNYFHSICYYCGQQKWKVIQDAEKNITL